MTSNSDTKFVIGVLVATVLVIGGGAYLTNLRSTPTASQTVPASLMDRLVREDSPSVGPKDAKVTVVEFGDFQCPACGALHTALKQVKDRYKDKSVQFVFRNYPLPQHQFAPLAAEAALAANAQHKFWEYHDTLFEHQSNLTQSDLEQYGTNIGLDPRVFFSEAFIDHTYKDTVARDIADGNALGINQTPTLFINDTKYSGRYSVTDLSSAIDEKLK